MSQLQVTALDLIENAAEAITAEITARWLPSKPVIVFAGWGNNGADALETARMLGQQGYNPEVYLFNLNNRISPECRVCRDRLVQSGTARVYEITGREQFIFPDVTPDHLVIEGLFGSGLDRPLPGSLQMLIQTINRSGATIVSIDVPAGLSADWNIGMTTQNMVHANLTLALSAPRLSFLLPDNAEVVGEWKVLDVGLSPDAMRASTYSSVYVNRGMVRQFLSPRNPFVSKADLGSALLVAGQRGMMGAAVLAAEGALRSGVGKVTVHSAACGIDILQTAVPCAMFRSDANAQFLTAIDNVDAYSAVAVGPGIGTDDATVHALEVFLKNCSNVNRPVVLDADALNCIAKRPILLDYLPMLSVLTPHAGEFDRIFGPQPSHEARLRKAIDVAQFHRVIIVLKGRYTAVVRPDGNVFFNSSGTPALATPGSGDVLTGIIASLMAQGNKPEKATVIACFIHGVAGEIAAAEHGEYGVTAMDVARCVGKAIMRIAE